MITKFLFSNELITLEFHIKRLRKMKNKTEISVIQTEETMKSLSRKHLALSIVLSIIFTIGFLYGAFIFFILGIQLLLIVIIPVDFDAVDYTLIEMLKWIGLIMLILLVLLISIGFLIKRFDLSMTGSVFMMLPVLSTFALPMIFYLSGLNAFLLLWLPLLKIFPGILTLGDILFAPFIPILVYWGFSEEDPLFDVLATPYIAISLIVLILGTFILFFSIATLLCGKTTEKNVVDFWIYRYTRHPQYLGFLMVTYGTIIFMCALRWSNQNVTPPPTLFWLLTALSTIGLAIHEENKLIVKNNSDYRNYRERTPFMIPLPKHLINLILMPCRVALEKNWPENDKEILKILLIYGILAIILSIPFYFLFHLPSGYLNSW